MSSGQATVLLCLVGAALAELIVIAVFLALVLDELQRAARKRDDRAEKELAQRSTP